YRRSCQESSAFGCYNLAANLATGRGVAKNIDEALKFYSLACEENHREACFYYGTYMEKQGRPQISVGSYQRACERKLAMACVNLGNLLLKGVGAPKDPEAALKSYERACEFGLDQICDWLKKQGTSGPSRPVDDSM